MKKILSLSLFKLTLAMTSTAFADISYERAQEYAHFAGLAYQPSNQAITYAHGFAAEYSLYNFRAKTGFGVESDFGYVAVRKRENYPEIVISCRGTVTASDALTGGMITMVPLFGDDSALRVHQGFKETAFSAFENLKKQIKLIQKELGEDYGKATMRLTGHSLGGATAAILSFLLSQDPDLAPNGVEELTTFGAPYVGNKNFVQAMEKHVKAKVHFYQPSDAVAQGHADREYHIWTDRVEVPTPAISKIHVLSGYKEGLAIKYNKKEVARFMPYVDAAAPYLYKVINSIIHAGKDWVMNKQNQKWLIKSVADYLSRGVIALLSFWSLNDDDLPALNLL